MTAKKKFKDYFICGNIDSDTVTNLFAALIESNEYKNFNILNLWISSEGGSVTDAFALIDLLNYHKKLNKYIIHTYALGEVASAGAFLFFIGKERIMFEKTRFFIHEHKSTYSEPISYRDMKKNVKEEDILNGLYFKYTKDQLGLSEEQCKNLFKIDGWITDKDIIKFNIITKRIIND
jgi:ATP-dependent protease ClpP protease subunit